MRFLTCKTLTTGVGSLATGSGSFISTSISDDITTDSFGSSVLRGLAGLGGGLWKVEALIVAVSDSTTSF